MNTSSIGSINFSSLRGVAYNGEFFALGETDNKISIFGKESQD